MLRWLRRSSASRPTPPAPSVAAVGPAECFTCGARDGHDGRACPMQRESDASSAAIRATARQLGAWFPADTSRGGRLDGVRDVPRLSGVRDVPRLQ
jgi:hypothetical protein